MGERVEGNWGRVIEKRRGGRERGGEGCARLRSSDLRGVRLSFQEAGVGRQGYKEELVWGKILLSILMVLICSLGVEWKSSSNLWTIHLALSFLAQFLIFL